MSQITNNKGQEQPQKSLTISLLKPIPFNTVMETIFITTKDVKYIISSIMSEVYKDFKGCNVEPVVIPDKGPEIKVTLYFDPAVIDERGTTKAINLVENEVSRGNNIFSNIAAISSTATKAKIYELSKQGFDGLIDLVHDAVRDKCEKNPKFSFLTEVTVNQPNQVKSTLALVDSIDIIKIFKIVYGDKEGRNKYQYRFCSIQPIGSGAINGETEFILGLERVNINNANEAGVKAGRAPINNGIPMVGRVNKE